MKIKCLIILSILLCSSTFVSTAFAFEKNVKSDIKENSEKYNMVIISRNIFKSTLQPLIEHKNSHGIKTYFKNVNEIYRQYDGRDNAERIKYFIKDAIETHNISYVLIAGSIIYVPMRECMIYEECLSLKWPTSSDLYYADIYNETGEFCSWDTNNNNLFGEYLWVKYEEDVNIDYVDLHADVHIGRIPCFSNRDLKIVVNKIINYENTAFGSDWFNKILLIGGDTFPKSGPIEGEYVTGLIGQEMKNKGFENTKLWASENNFNFWKINREINKGHGFISYSGHGLPNSICTSKPNDDRLIWYFNFNLFGLKNQEMQPIVFFDACSTAQFITELPFFSPFAYNIVKKSSGGAIASIAATNVGWVEYDEEGNLYGCHLLNFLFFENYEEGITVGNMLTKAQGEYIEILGKDCSTLAEFILIGDPSLKVGGYP